MKASPILLLITASIFIKSYFSLYHSVKETTIIKTISLIFTPNKEEIVYYNNNNMKNDDDNITSMQTITE